MSIRIESITLDDVLDKRCLLYNAQIARKLVFGDEWTKLRIGIRFAFGDFGDTLQASQFFFGLMSNPSSNPLTNGPLSLNSESNFLGISTRRGSNVSSWTRAESGGNPYYSSVNFSFVNLHQGVFVETDSLASHLTACLAVPLRMVLVIQYEKVGGGVINTNYVRPSSTGFSFLRDFPTKEALWGGMEIVDDDLSDVEEWMEDQSTNGTSDTYGRSLNFDLTVDEVAQGPLNAIAVGWNRSIVPLGISDIVYARFG